MNTHIIPPIARIAGAAAASFYTLHVFAAKIADRTIYIFFLIALVLCVLTLLSACSMLLHKKQKSLRFCMHTRHATRFMRCTAISIMIGAAIGAYAEWLLQKKHQPPQTLGQLPSVRAITAELTGDPVPSESGYYRVPANLIACTTGKHAQFSASGTIELRIPSALVDARYAGGITRIDNMVEPDAMAVLLHSTEKFTDFMRTAQTCTFYVKGVQLFIQGKCNKTGTVFYAQAKQPIFLGWDSPFNQLRALLRFALMRLLYSWHNAGGLLLALLAADKAFLPKACIEAFRNAGLAHILALSGMHVSLVATAAMQGGKLFGHKKYAALFSLAAVCLFVWFAGEAPSLNRALGMVCIAAAGQALGLHPSQGAILCAMITVHIACSSSDAVTLGFMLSYAACAGIIIFGNACVHLITGKIPPIIAHSIAASVGAQLFTAPIVTYTIGAFASWGIIASCIVSPFVSIFLITGLICIPLALLCPPLTPLLGKALSGMYRIIFLLAHFFARRPVITLHTARDRFIFSIAAFGLGILLTALAYARTNRMIKRLPSLT